MMNKCDFCSVPCYNEWCPTNKGGDMTEYEVKFEEYKGSPVLVIYKNGYRVMGFGVAKAKAILACTGAIEKFVKKFEKLEE